MVPFLSRNHDPFLIEMVPFSSWIFDPEMVPFLLRIFDPFLKCYHFVEEF